MGIIEYIEKHAIIFIGNLVDDKCVVVETIPDNPKELIEYVINNNCYISEILWWDRVPIALGSKIGYGGPPDPRDPQNYYFAETDIMDFFEPTTSFSKYVEYIDTIKEQNNMYDLYPSFDIYRK